MSKDSVETCAPTCKPPECLECGATARFGSGADAYPNEPDLHSRPMWVCACGAYASCRRDMSPRGLPSSRQTRAIQTNARNIADELEAELLASGMGRKRAKHLVCGLIKSVTGRWMRYPFYRLEQVAAMLLVEALSDVLRGVRDERASVVQMQPA